MAIHWSPPSNPTITPVERRRLHLAAARLALLRERRVSERLLSVIYGQRDPLLDALLDDWGLSTVDWLDDIEHDVPDEIGVASLEPGHHGVYATPTGALVLVQDHVQRQVGELEVWQELFRVRVELGGGALTDASGQPLDRVLVRARLFELGGTELSTWAAGYL